MSDVLQSAASPFDSIAPLYDRFASITEDGYLPWLQCELPAHAFTAVNLGCGTGQFDDLLARRCQSLLGIDYSSGQLEVARSKNKNPNVTYVKRDLRRIEPDSLGQFDLVFSVTALHHFGDQAEVLRSVRSLVRPGGHLVVIDCVRTAPRWAYAPQGRAFHAYRWMRTVRGAFDTLVRQRSLVDAMVMFRLRMHPAWRALAELQLPLSRQEFHDIYSRELPGARISDLNQSVCAAVWRAVTVDGMESLSRARQGSD